jgi:hypothetical protein
MREYELIFFDDYIVVWGTGIPLRSLGAIIDVSNDFFDGAETVAHCDLSKVDENMLENSRTILREGAKVIMIIEARE